MLLFEEIVVEVLMIAAVVVAVACLTRLLQLSVSEKVYLRRLRREYTARTSRRARSPEPRRVPPLTARVKHDAMMAPREKRA